MPMCAPIPPLMDVVGPGTTMSPLKEFGLYRDQKLPTGATTTRDTRSQLTAFTDSKADPAIKMGFETKREAIRLEMFEGQIKHPSLFEQLYCESRESSLAAVELFGLVKAHMRPENRWEKMPRSPESEKEVQTAFMDISGMLKGAWDLQLKREGNELSPSDIHNTSQRFVGTRDGGYLKPDVFFQGSGLLFPTLPPRKVDDPPPWSVCVAPGDLKTTKDKDSKKLFGQLGTYAEQVFAAQENRRFVPTFRLDECSLYFFTFDRGGAVSGRAIDYHIDATKLCVLVQTLLLSFKDSDLGFDPSIFYEDGFKYIYTAQHEVDGRLIPRTMYIVDRTLFHSTNIRGNGSIYWLVRKKDDEDTEARYLIKDSWIAGGCERERQLLERCKGIMGVAPVVYIQDIEVRGQLDSVSNNRPRGIITPPVDNRVHTRVVLRASMGAKLLDQFSSTLELLNALRDAVLGHRKLYASGVLHGNITPTHILIQPNADRGNCGVLIDLQYSVKTDSPSDRPSISSGSRAYQSRNSLNKTPQTYSHVDDLESFYYVLCYMVICYPASGSMKPKLAPSPISSWFSKDGGRADKTEALMNRTCPFPIDASFEPPVEVLVESLRGFFRDQLLGFWSQKGTPTADEDYDEFLKQINLAIEAVTQGEQKPESWPQDTDRASDTGMLHSLFDIETKVVPETRDDMSHREEACVSGSPKPPSVAASLAAATSHELGQWVFQEPEDSFSGFDASGSAPYQIFGTGGAGGSYLEYPDFGPVADWDINYISELDPFPFVDSASQHDLAECPGPGVTAAGDELYLTRGSGHFIEVSESSHFNQNPFVSGTADDNHTTAYPETWNHAHGKRREEKPDSLPAPPTKRIRLNVNP